MITSVLRLAAHELRQHFERGKTFALICITAREFVADVRYYCMAKKKIDLFGHL
jgi:hypothetical protein